MKKIFGILVIGGLLALTAPALAEHEAHVHGVARMDLVVEGDELQIELETPLANLLSFEHAPESAAQRDEVRRMADLLYRADRLFILPAEAQCRQKTVALESEALDGELLLPAELRQGEQADGDAAGHDEHGESGHADLDVEVYFSCGHPEKLHSLRVELFRAFPGLHELEVRMVGPKGQSAAELTPESNLLRW